MSDPSREASPVPPGPCLAVLPVIPGTLVIYEYRDKIFFTFPQDPYINVGG
jgi:hypothetical protein